MFMSEKFERDIDDLKYLAIMRIVHVKNLCSNDKLNVNDLLGFLFDRALNEYILENEDVLFNTLKTETSLIYDKIDNREHEFKDLFTIDELIKESKRKDDERQNEGDVYETI